jgi:hypothetical protein
MSARAADFDPAARTPFRSGRQWPTTVWVSPALGPAAQAPRRAAGDSWMV